MTSLIVVTESAVGVCVCAHAYVLKDDAAEAMLDFMYVMQEAANAYATQLIWALVLSAGSVFLWIWRSLGKQEAARHHAQMISSRPVFSSPVPTAQSGPVHQPSHFISVYKNRYAAKERAQSEDRATSSDCDVLRGYNEAGYRHRSIPRSVWRRHGQSGQEKPRPRPGDRRKEYESGHGGRHTTPMSTPGTGLSRGRHSSVTPHNHRTDDPGAAAAEVTTPQQHHRNHNHHHHHRHKHPDNRHPGRYPKYSSAKDWSGASPASNDVMLIRGKLSQQGPNCEESDVHAVPAHVNKNGPRLPHSPPKRKSSERCRRDTRHMSVEEQLPHSPLRFLSLEDRLLLERIYSTQASAKKPPKPSSKNRKKEAFHSPPKDEFKSPNMHEGGLTVESYIRALKNAAAAAADMETEEQRTERLQRGFVPYTDYQYRPSSAFLSPTIRKAASEQSPSTGAASKKPASSPKNDRSETLQEKRAKRRERVQQRDRESQERVKTVSAKTGKIDGSASENTPPRDLPRKETEDEPPRPTRDKASAKADDKSPSDPRQKPPVSPRLMRNTFTVKDKTDLGETEEHANGDGKVVPDNAVLDQAAVETKDRESRVEAAVRDAAEETARQPPVPRHRPQVRAGCVAANRPP
nr:hypothetical protein BaRGS_031445 [Batillaria attramentaria]